MDTQKTYTIGELARDFDVTTRTIRFYEDQGLLSPKRRGQTRIYSPADRTTLKLILRGKRFGFSLEQIRQLLELYQPGGANRTQIAATIGIARERFRCRDILHAVPFPQPARIAKGIEPRFGADTRAGQDDDALQEGLHIGQSEDAAYLIGLKVPANQRHMFVAVAFKSLYRVSEHRGIEDDTSARPVWLTGLQCLWQIKARQAGRLEAGTCARTVDPRLPE